MNYIITRLFIHGERFDPVAAEAQLGVLFSEKSKKGDPVRWGGISQLGFAVLSGSEEGIRATTRCSVPQFVAMVCDIIEPLRSLGAEELQLHQDVYHDGQCNLEFTDQEVAAIHALGLGLSVSCHQDDALIREVEDVRTKAGGKSNAESRPK